MAVRDACTTRHEPAVQDSIRRLAERMGYMLEETRYTRELTQCCGYGGLTGYANPQVSREMAEHCAKESGRDFLTYCANCRDQIAKEDRRAIHILELAYPGGASPDREVPGYSLRRENRERLKASLLRENWGESILDPKYEVSLSMDEGMAQVLEDRMILKEDIARTIGAAEESQNKLLDKASGQFIAMHKSGTVTYWVWYSPEDEGYRVHRAYSHRMDIEV